jgi:serpin B
MASKTLLLLTLLLVFCTEKHDVQPIPDQKGIMLEKKDAIILNKTADERDTNPAITSSELSQVATGNNAFGVDLFKKLVKENENTFFSPYSISVALSMTWGGACGQTAKEMAQTLRFPFDQEKQHAGINSLDRSLKNSSEKSGFQLNIVNQLWGDQRFSFLHSYLKLLTINYGAGMMLLDFIHQPEPSRILINNWVRKQTKDRIKDLIPLGGIIDSTKLVLTNAIYFKAEWATTFNAANTFDRKFQRSVRDSIMVKTMSQKAAFPVAKTDDYQAIELPYKGNEMSMLIIMPEPGKMAMVMDSLSPKYIATVENSLKANQINLLLPKFKFTTQSLSLALVLDSLGMRLPFNDSADFSGMDGKKDLIISNVFHKAFVAVDEKGTEAAAATAVIMTTECSTERPVPLYTFDHPFIFLIHDNKTNTLLFMGRINDPKLE